MLETIDLTSLGIGAGITYLYFRNKINELKEQKGKELSNISNQLLQYKQSEEQKIRDIFKKAKSENKDLSRLKNLLCSRFSKEKVDEIFEEFKIDF